MGKVRYNKSVPLLPVELPVVNGLYHVSWAWSRGIVGRCVEVYPDKKLVKLIRPKTRTEFKNLVPWSDLRHTRKAQNNIEKGNTTQPS